MLPGFASAATVTWDGEGTDGTCGGGAGDGNKWSCGLNWSTNAIPTSADVATFNATSVKNATMDATINVIGINIASTYSGTISPSSAIAITIGTTGFIQAGGTFTSTTSTLTNAGVFTKTGGTFLHNGGTFTATGIDRSYAFSTAETFHNFTVAKSNVEYINITGQSMIVLGTLTLTDGQIMTGTVDMRGAAIVQASTFDGGTATIDFGDNDTAQTYTLNGGIAPIIRFNHDADKNDSVVFAQDATLYGFHVMPGFGANPIPLDYGTPNKVVTIAAGGIRQGAGTLTAPALLINQGPFTKTGGILLHNNGTFTTTGPDTGYAFSTAETFHNLTVAKNNVGYLNITGQSMIVLGALTLTDGRIMTGTVDMRGTAITQASTFDGGTGFLDFGDNDTAQTYTINGGIAPIIRFDNASDANDLVVFNANGTLYGLSITAGFGANAVPFTYNGYNLKIGDGEYAQAGGIFTAPTILDISGAFTKTGGEFVEGNGTINIISNGSKTMNVDVSETFHDVTFSTPGYPYTTTIASGDTIFVNGDLTLTNGSVESGTIEVRGNITQAATFDGGTTILNFGDNDTAQTYTMSGGIGPGIRFDHPSDANDSVILTANATINSVDITSNFGANVVPFNYNGNGSGPYTLTVGNGLFNQASGTFVAPEHLIITGNFTKTGGEFVEGSGTVNFSPYGNSTINVDVSETFYNVIKNTFISYPYDSTISTGDTVIVTNDLTLTNGAINTGFIDVRGDAVLESTFDGGTAPLVFSGSAVQTFTTNNSATFNADIIINKSGGQVNLVGNLIMDANSQDLIVQEGVLDLNGSNLTVTGGTNQTLVVQDGGVLRLQGNETISASALYPQFQFNSTVYYDGTSGPYTLKDYTYSNVTIDGAGATFNLPGAKTFEDATITAGTLDVTDSNYDLSVSGNITVTSPGTLNNRSNTVTFSGQSQTITGDITFNNLTSNRESMFDFSTVSYWKLNETAAGSSVVDSSGNANNGTPFGTSGANNLPQPSTDVPIVSVANPRSLHFDGTDDYLDMGSPTILTGLISYTLSAWVKMTNEQAGAIMGDKTVWNSGFPYMYLRDSTNEDFACGHDATGLRVGEIASAQVGTWIHMLCRWDGATLQMYVDNSLIGSQAETSVPTATVKPLVVGVTNAIPNFSGYLDDVRIYNYALTTDEIADLASGNFHQDTSLTFAADSTTTVNGTLTLSGLDNDNRVNLVSSELGTPWNLVVNGTENITWVDVRDSHASGTSTPLSHANTVDSGNNENWGFDETGPTITDINSSETINGTYGAGSIIDLDFTFSENITTTDTITVTLNSGGSCTFSGVTNSATATCAYTVLAGENTADLAVSNLSGTINDQASNPMTDFTPTTNLSDHTDIVIDTTAPIISSISSNKVNGRYKAGEVIDIDLTFSKTVTTNGTAVTVTLDTTRTCTFSIPALTYSLTASCEYTVQAGDTSSDLTVSSVIGTLSDQYGNAMTNFTPSSNLAATKAIIIDTLAPTILSVSSNKANATYGAGEIIDIDVTFSENVTSIGSVTVTLETGATDRTCTFTVVNSATASCNYAVQSGDTSLDLDATDISGTINDVAGNALTNFVPATSLATNKDLVIDASAPVITSISSDVADGRYNAGDVIDIDLTFSTEVTSTGDVTVTLETGDTDRTCTFSVSNALTASCNYTVQAGDTSADLTVKTVAGTIADQSAVAMTDFTPQTNLAANKAIIIDTTAPTILSVTSHKADGQYTTGTEIDIDVNFSEAVTSTELVTVTLETGDTDRTCTFSVTNASTGTCNYTVQEGDSSADLDVLSITTAGTISDLAGNLLASLTPASTLAANKALVINTVAPVITSISSDKPNGRYTVGETIDIDLTFSKAISGSLLVTLETGAVDRTCTIALADYAATGTCDYTVQAGDTTSDLTVKTVSGTVEDAAGNPMVNFFPASNLASTKAIVIDTTAPTLSSRTPIDNATGIASATNLTLRFTETVTIGTGNITIKLSSDDTTIESINVTSGQVTGGSTAIITINPSVTLDTLTEYYVEIPSTAFEDLTGNAFAGISGTTAWSFTVGDPDAPTILSVTSPKTSGTYTVGDSIPVTITFSEAISSNGLVTVTFDTGRTCTFTILDASTGTCGYTVQSGDTSLDLDVLSVSGSIEDQFGNPLTDFTPLSTLAAGKDIVIDTTIPPSSSSSSSSSSSLSSSSSSSSSSPTNDTRGGGGGGGTTGLRFISILNRIDAAKETILARFGKIKRAGERLLAQEQEESQDTVALQREARIAERILERENTLARLQQEKEELAKQYAQQREERVREALALKERELLAQQEALALEQQGLALERAQNRRDRERRLADRKQQESIAARTPAGPETEVIALRRNRLFLLVDANPVLYKDVPLDEWFSPYVSYVVEEEIAQGYRTEAGVPTGEFGVGNPVTYAEILKMALEATRGNDQLPISNIQLANGSRNQSAKGTWASSYVAQAEALQIDVFARDLDVFSPASRGAVLSIILQAAGIPTGIKLPSSYPDVSDAHRFVGAIMTATAYGLVEGHPDGTFQPDEPINRAEAAKIIALAKELLQ